MALMLGKLYSALRLANIPDDAAREAAEEIAGYDSSIAELKSDMKLVKWMLGFNLALSIGILAKLLIPN